MLFPASTFNYKPFFQQQKQMWFKNDSVAVVIHISAHSVAEERGKKSYGFQSRF